MRARTACTQHELQVCALQVLEVEGVVVGGEQAVKVARGRRRFTQHRCRGGASGCCHRLNGVLVAFNPRRSDGIRRRGSSTHTLPSSQEVNTTITTHHYTDKVASIEAASRGS